MASRVSLFCPFCNAADSQPVLSPMACAYVLDRRPNEGEAAAEELQLSRDVLEPHYEYRCERCGFSEIHESRLGEAA